MSDRILIEDSGALKGITIQQIIDLITPTIRNQAVPVGTICDYAGPNAPTNWMLCQGQLLDRDVYADLFSAIGGYFSIGDGTTTFGIPDLRGRVCAGVDDGAGRIGDVTMNVGLNGTLGSAGGLHYNFMNVQMMPVHAHPLNVNMYTTTQEGGSNYGLVAGGPFAGRVFVTSSSVYVTPNTAGEGQPQNNVQPTMCTNKIIKVLNA